MARILMTIAFLLVAVSGVAQSQASESKVPRGYYSRLELSHQGQRLSFGPFVGYYFKPQTGADMTRLDFLCLNERSFYTDQLPEDAVLFHGEAVLATLPGLGAIPQGKQRITPVFLTRRRLPGANSGQSRKSSTCTSIPPTTAMVLCVPATGCGTTR